MTEMDSFPAGTPCWVDVGTDDTDAALAFYGGLFGWVGEVDSRPEAGGYGLFALHGRSVAGFMRMQDGQPPSWSTYIASDDVDATAAKIAAAGGHVVVEPMDVLDAGRMLFAADPTGAVFGVWQAAAHAGSGVVNEPGSLCWNELTTPDVEVAQAFYGAVFGWEPEVHGAEDAEAPFVYRVQRVGANMVAGIMEMDSSWGDVPSHWMTYFAVADVDESAERVDELLGKVCVEPFDMPYGRVAVIDDPAGATFSIVQLAAPDG
jgi:predicted enzyme related to lactoylglutathione lyase